METYKACVSLTGTLTPERSLVGHFQNLHTKQHETLPLFHPEYARSLQQRTDASPSLLAASRTALDGTEQRLAGTREIHVLIDSRGGADEVFNNLMWAMGEVRGKGGKVIFYCANDVNSTAANITATSGKDPIHCLPTTQFQWHLPQLNEELGGPERLAELAGASNVAELLQFHASRQRQQLYQILGFFGARLRDDAQWLPMCENVLRSFYTDVEQGGEDLLELQKVVNASLHHRKPTPEEAAEFDAHAGRFQPFYKQEGELMYSGKRLRKMGIVQTHPTVADLARQFARESGWKPDIGKTGRVWDRFFTVSSVLADARERGVVGHLDYDADGDLAFITSSEHRETVRRLMMKHLKK